MHVKDAGENLSAADVDDLSGFFGPQFSLNSGDSLTAHTYIGAFDSLARHDRPTNQQTVKRFFHCSLSQVRLLKILHKHLVIKP